MKKIFKIVFIVLLVFGLIGVGAVYYLNRGLEKGADVSIDSIDLSSVDDGIYKGIYKAGRFTNSIQLNVEDNKITKITLLDDVTFARDDVSNNLFERVIKRQRIDVDVISGATVTSKAYLKAIEDALSNK